MEEKGTLDVAHLGKVVVGDELKMEGVGNKVTTCEHMKND